MNGITIISQVIGLFINRLAITKQSDDNNKMGDTFLISSRNCSTGSFFFGAFLFFFMFKVSK